ncbi:hypothetical protein [Halobacillus naozhouensis]|uniref:Uncharacterized protein n=1 Tax=Halobacillus naozhouensis TaxID=554880 RepID=A0ABY8IZ93_9BACI|nr:hypothetical protein [Halobacillus naozhouensis]WFT73941.1 hypothetical protein P9989_16425 [Halobacillus naozhouensis]
MENKESLYLTHNEIYVLLGLIKAPIAFGIDAPFLALSNEEVKKEWEGVIISLRDRNLLGKDEDGEFWIDEDMITSLSVMAYSNVVIQVDSLYKMTSHSTFYVAEEFVIECEKLNNKLFRLQQLDEPNVAIKNVILPRVGLDHKNASKSGILTLPGTFINECIDNKSYLNIDDENVRNLNDSNQSLSLWKDLKKSLNRSERISRMVMYYFTDNNWKVEGVFAVFSPSNNWTLRMIEKDGKEYLQAKQVDLLGLTKEYGAVLERTLKDKDYIISK